MIGALMRIYVLFIGNSLTYTNDLPRTLADIARMGGDTIVYATAARPNYALVDHMNGGSNAEQLLAREKWDYVILQQGPSTLRVSSDSLVIWTRMWDPLIRRRGARTALLMVWPSSDRAEYFDDVREAYHTAAESVHGVFIPAGEAWRSAWALDSTLQLWGDDGFHPSPLGTYLAALTVYERVTGKDARQLPPRAVVGGRQLGVDSATVRVLQRAAHEANHVW